ncbi:MAG: hypothetical protein CMK09_09140 [Ponticaulis sp.]|nr:hypothetical protein [Ponticaulis sp.]|tara:strand:- start:54606 stop:55244 length:639 start_codon:yes stop_codon:yes gene_type:complete
MIPAPASDMPHTLPGRTHAIGLFLVRLMAYLLRLHQADKTSVRADIAAMVHSAHGMVHTFIRNRAAAQLKAAGCLNEASALRSKPGELAPAASHTQTEPISPAELIERLEATIETFERAEALASALACMMLCVHCLTTPWQRRPRHAQIRRASAIQTRRVGLGPPKPVPVGRGPPYMSPLIPNLVWDPCQSAGKMPGGTSQAWIPAFAGMFG